MQDMLAKIVEMDEKARELTAEAEKIKAASEEDIAKVRENIYNDYIERARKRIKINEAAERKAANEKWLKKKAEQEKAVANLEKLYDEKGDDWVNSIVDRVLDSR